MLLCLETSAEYCSVSVSREGEILASKTANERFTHASSLTLFIEECVKLAGVSLGDLAAIAVSMGPGSYTGLRVGLSTAKGMAYALDKPLIGVNTLQALAYGIAKERDFEAALYIPMIDARRMEVYTAVFDEQQKQVKETEALILDENAYEEESGMRIPIVICGNAVVKAQEVLKIENAIYFERTSSAEDMIALAQRALEQKDFLDVAYSEPFYLKRPNITKPKMNVLDKIINDKNL